MALGARHERRAAALAFLLAVLPFAWLVARFDFLVDDAFISFRYAQHLAQGSGLVFNVGEAHPVEGYSNFLWVLVLAAVERAGLDPAVHARTISIACGLLLLARFASFVARRTGDAPWTATLSTLFLATLPPLAVWSTGGLETMPFTLALFSTYERLLGDPERPKPWQASVCAALAVLLRADGFVWVGAVLAAALARAWPEKRKALARASLACAGLAALVLALYLAWRWSHYHALGPNTARVKVSLGMLTLERGAQYVASLLLAFLSLAIVLAFGLRLARRSVLAREASIVVLGSLGYLALVGGDWMMMFRMAVPALPFFALLFAAGLEELARRGVAQAAALGGTLACVVLSLLPAFDLHPVPLALRAPFHFRWTQPELSSEYALWKKGTVDIDDWILRGRALALHTRPGESMVLGNIGAMGYYSGLVIYDLHGLTNAEPFPPPDPTAKRTAGHDRVLPMDHFAKDRPTYQNARLASVDQPMQGLPAKWQDPSDEVWKRIEILHFPLSEADGFPPRTELQVFRYLW